MDTLSAFFTILIVAVSILFAVVYISDKREEREQRKRNIAAGSNPRPAER
jgi:hypothetical protein